jgi:hypothetical protein
MSGDLDDLNLNQWSPIGRRVQLTEADRVVLGPAARAQTQSADPDDILNGLVEAVRNDLYSEDLGRVRMAIGAIRRALELLIEQGHPSFRATLNDLEAKLESLSRDARQQLVKKFRSPTFTREEVEQAGQAIVELIDSGCWPGDAGVSNAA